MPSLIYKVGRIFIPKQSDVIPYNKKMKKKKYTKSFKKKKKKNYVLFDLHFFAVSHPRYCICTMNRNETMEPLQNCYMQCLLVMWWLSVLWEIPNKRTPSFNQAISFSHVKYRGDWGHTNLPWSTALWCECTVTQNRKLPRAEHRAVTCSLEPN